MVEILPSHNKEAVLSLGTAFISCTMDDFNDEPPYQPLWPSTVNEHRESAITFTLNITFESTYVFCSRYSEWFSHVKFNQAFTYINHSTAILIKTQNAQTGYQLEQVVNMGATGLDLEVFAPFPPKLHI